ncbi:MAG: SUMF1/EgtB/PvdO family nonheme iron enzyme, partial [bacterium]|nr:SUMF1/EgtB/PvdO family nonheme iron enzyme [bacterium]
MRQFYYWGLFFVFVTFFVASCEKDDNDSTEVVNPAPIEQTFPLGTSGATIDMIWIRPGSYWMGNNHPNPTAALPYHQVTLNYGFWIGKNEVTQTQWISLMDSNPSHFIGENLPVERVTWDSIHVFLDTLIRQSGDTLWRLPSEAEWEYACRAGTTTRFYWGDDPE